MRKILLSITILFSCVAIMPGCTPVKMVAGAVTGAATGAITAIV